MSRKETAGVGRWAVRVVAVAVLSLLATPLPMLAVTPARGQLLPSSWNGSRAELFIVDVATPTLMAGGPPGVVSAVLVSRGPDRADHVRFTYKVPASLSFVSASVAGGLCSFAFGTVSCFLNELGDNGRAPISITLRASGGTSAGTKPGSFSAPTSDEFNPAGGNLLSRMRQDDWIGTNEGSSLPARWEPNDPYTNKPPCDITVDVLGRLRRDHTGRRSPGEQGLRPQLGRAGRHRHLHGHRHEHRPGAADGPDVRRQPRWRGGRRRVHRRDREHGHCRVRLADPHLDR